MDKCPGPGSGVELSTTMVLVCLNQCLIFCDRINYEESMMVRLSVSKRERGRRKRANVMSSQLHSLTHFSDISALTGGTAHLDEVRLRYSCRRQLSLCQPNVFGTHYHEELGKGCWHLEIYCLSFTSVCLQDQNPVKKRKKISKKGRKKKGQCTSRT